MKQLDDNWLTEGLMDFEYKQYVLLAYLSEVKKCFDLARLYPPLSDLVFHYQNLLALKDQKQILHKRFPQKLSKADLDSLKLQYKQVVEDDALMKLIEDVVEFALPQMKSLLEEGKDLYTFVEEHLEISPVGISPLHKLEGYFFIAHHDSKDTDVYWYQVSVLENASERFRAIQTHFVERFAQSLAHSFEQIKLELVRRNKDLPNPATYLVYSNLSFPLKETLLPIAKRALVRCVCQ